MGPSLIGRLETLHQMAVWRSALSPARNPRNLKGMETRLHPDGMEQVWRTVPSLRGTDMKWMAPSRFGDGCAASIPEGTEGMFHPRGWTGIPFPLGWRGDGLPLGWSAGDRATVTDGRPVGVRDRSGRDAAVPSIPRGDFATTRRATRTAVTLHALYHLGDHRSGRIWLGDRVNGLIFR